MSFWINHSFTFCNNREIDYSYFSKKKLKKKEWFKLKVIWDNTEFFFNDFAINSASFWPMWKLSVKENCFCQSFCQKKKKEVNEKFKQNKMDCAHFNLLLGTCEHISWFLYSGIEIKNLSFLKPNFQKKKMSVTCIKKESLNFL